MRQEIILNLKLKEECVEKRNCICTVRCWQGYVEDF